MNIISIGINGTAPHDEDPIKGLRGHEEWRSAYLRIISDLWQGTLTKPETDGFFTAYDSSKGHEIHTLGHKKVKKLFEVYGYKIPENLRITFLRYGGEKVYEHHKKDKGKLANGWSEVVDDEKKFYSEVNMMIPPKPEDNNKMAYALTEFMAAGQVYPLTVG